MATQIGHMTDRISYIAKAAQDLQDLCNRPLMTEPDMFGEVETMAGRRAAIMRVADNIAHTARMTDARWDELMQATSAQVRESDHPKHSIL